MAIKMDRRQRVAFLTAVVTVIGALVALTTWAPATPAPTLSPRPSVAEPTGPAPSLLSLLTPLPGSADAPRLPPCDGALASERNRSAAPVAPVAGPVALRVVGQLGGVARAAAIDARGLFVGAGSQVIAVDLTDPRQPKEVASSAPLPGPVEGIAITSDLLVAAAGDAGLAVLDMHDFRLLSTMALPGYADAVAISGTVAFVADGPGGLRIVDLEDPDSPAQIGDLFDLHRIVDVAIADEVAYLAAADEGLLVVDVSDPGRPVELGRLFTGGYAFGVAVHGDHVLLADGWGGLRVIDVEDPASPRLEATVPSGSWVMGVAAGDRRAYLAAGGEGLQVVDLGDPRRPRLVGGLSPPGGQAIATTVAGGVAGVVDSAVGVRIVDVAVGSPIELDVFAPLMSADGLALAGTRVVVPAKRQGLRVVDVSDPTRPTDLPGFRTDDPVRAAAVVGSNLIIATSRVDYQNLFAVDLGTPGQPQPGPPFAGGLTYQVTVDGSLLLVAAELGLWLIDGGSSTPCELAYLDTASQGFLTTGVAVVGDLAYVTADDGIHVVDIADPRSPRLIGNAEINDDRAVGVEWVQALVAGSTLYATGSNAQLVGAFDIGSAAVPQLIGLVELPAPTATADQSGPFMAYAGGRLFVADQSGGLVALDVADPSRPQVAGRLRLPGSVVGVVADGDQLYVASDGGGFFVVEWSDDAGAVSRMDTRSLDGIVSVAAFRDPPLVQTSLVGAARCVVTTTADAGPGSLRSCAESAASGTVITFDQAVFPPDRPTTIAVRGGPIGVPGGVTIDGTGAGVILDGGGETETAFGLFDPLVVLSGLEIANFTGFGLDLGGTGHEVSGMVVHDNGEGGIRTCCNPGDGDVASDIRIVGNLVGLDRTGTRLQGAQPAGILLQGTGHVVGGPDPADRNVVAGNRDEIVIDFASDMTIEGNYIGTDPSGRIPLTAPEQNRAINGLSAAGNRVVANVVNGLIQFADPGSTYNSVVGNRVGVDPTGTQVVGRGGVLISEPFNRVGGALAGDGNIVNGGIAIESSATNVIVLGNRIMEDGRDGEASIIVFSPRTVIGGRAPGSANNMVGRGIVLRSGFNVVIGNRIQAESIAGEAPDDLDHGIRLEGGERNYIVANAVDTDAGVGISLSHDAHANVVRGNFVRGSAVGIFADPTSTQNLVFGNAFADNRIHARDEGSANRWDHGGRGNHWSGLAGFDADGDGVFDNSRPVAPAGIDRYPLATPPPTLDDS